MINPDDRRAIEDLFAKLEHVERTSGPRDRDAEELIAERMRDQPASPYYMAQTIVVQERALEEAQRRIQDLEAQLADRSRQGSVARPGGPWGGNARNDDAQRGGGFLAGAAQTALGVTGGILLGNLIGGLFGAGQAQAEDLTPQQDDADAGFDDQDNGFGDDNFDIGGDF